MSRLAIKLLRVALVLFPAVTVGAQEPPPLEYFPTSLVTAQTKVLAAQLKADALAGKPGERIATVSIGKLFGREALLVRREGNGPGEMHLVAGHLNVITSGEASLLVGGQLVERTPSQAGQVRGTIRNSVKRNSCPATLSTSRLDFPIRCS